MSEAKLVFNSDIKQLERDNSKLVKDNARLAESLRKLKEEGIAVGDAWTKQQKKTATANDAWLAGLKQIEAQARATKAALEGGVLAEKGRAYQARQDANLQAAVAMSKQLPVVASEARKTKNELLSLSRESGAEIGGMITTTFGVASAVGVVSNAYRTWRNEIEAIGAAHRTTAVGIAREIATAGDLAQAGRISEAINAPGTGTPEQRISAFSGIREAAPNLPLDRRLALMQEAAQQAPAVSDLRSFGGLMGSLADIKPQAGTGDIADLAVAIQAKAGAGAEKLGGDKFLRAVKSQVASGKTPEEALGFALAALDANVSPETITAAAVGGRLSREQQFQLSRVKPEAQKSFTDYLLGAERDDMAGNRMLQFGAFPEGRTAIKEQGVAEASVGGVGESDLQQLRDTLRAKSAKRGAMARFGQTIGEAGDVMREIGRIGPVDYEQRQRRMINVAEQAGAITSQDATDMRAALEANTRAIQEATRSRTSVNVDRHTD